MYQKDIPGSFAANFDLGSRRAMQSYNWGVLSCDNCYVVAGAGA